MSKVDKRETRKREREPSHRAEPPRVKPPVTRAELETLRARARRRVGYCLAALVIGCALILVGRGLVNGVLASERAAGREVRPWDVLDQSWPGMLLLALAFVLAFAGMLGACLNALYARHVSSGLAKLASPAE